ncbi:cubilin-like, partial [Stegodyphus dumicola]|uniref:cubilin-like n=1 Tax=Stegodyphus dumicola TaxID=202533 RepID=UPI0015AA6EB8
MSYIDFRSSPCWVMNAGDVKIDIIMIAIVCFVRYLPIIDPDYVSTYDKCEVNPAVTTYSCEGCGSNFTNTRGQIFSPYYPDIYHGTLNCAYTIGKAGQFIGIQFDDNFSDHANSNGNQNCASAYLEIYQEDVFESNRQGKYCDSNTPESRTLLGPVTIRFINSNADTAHGFELKYEVLDCGGILTDPRGVISSPSHYDLLHYWDCIWQITAQPDRVIALKFSNWNLKPSAGCVRNSLEIWDGNVTGPLIGRICGKGRITFKSTGNQLTVRYRSTSEDTSNRFSAFYYNTYGVSQGCGGIRNISNGELGEIVSPDINSDGFYESNLDCSWLIVSSSPDQVILLNFTSFSVEDQSNNSCVFDYLEVRDGISKDSPLIGHYCGSIAPSPIITSGNKVTVIFHSNDDINLAGFAINYSLVP